MANHQTKTGEPNTANPKAYSQTWMLFESGSGVTVDLFLHEPPREITRPIDAYVVTECEGDFTGSARRAAEAVYDLAKQSGSNTGPVVVGYDLHGLSSDIPVSGPSGGLAFAIALAKKLFKYDPGPVAATGEVKSGHDGGPVGPIKGIQAKLEAACRLLPNDGWVFYPKENDEEISDALRQALTEKGLKLRAISSVGEALSELFEIQNLTVSGSTGNKPPKFRFLWASAVVLILISGASAAMWITGWNPFASSIASKKSVPPAPVDIPQTTFIKTETSPNISIMIPLAAQKKTDSALFTVDIKGETPLASELAHHLSSQLRDNIKKDKALASQAIQLSGWVKILQIEEIPTNNNIGIHTHLTATVSALTCRSKKGTRTYSDPQVSINGDGPAKSLLQQAALNLFSDIFTRLKNDQQKQTDGSLGSTGFE